jgi:hypothetical protein
MWVTAMAAAMAGMLSGIIRPYLHRAATVFKAGISYRQLDDNR